jgi:hypothetical protein
VQDTHILIKRANVSKLDSLAAPDDAKNDPDSFEILRAWVINKKLYLSMRAHVWDDPAAYGIMLADMIRNIANEYHQANGMGVADAIRRVRQGLEAELDSSADDEA